VIFSSATGFFAPSCQEGGLSPGDRRASDQECFSKHVLVQQGCKEGRTKRNKLARRYLSAQDPPLRDPWGHCKKTMSCIEHSRDGWLASQAEGIRGDMVGKKKGGVRVGSTPTEQRAQVRGHSAESRCKR
jgi:hypothetical protein